MTSVLLFNSFHSWLNTFNPEEASHRLDVKRLPVQVLAITSSSQPANSSVIVVLFFLFLLFFRPDFLIHLKAEQWIKIGRTVKRKKAKRLGYIVIMRAGRVRHEADGLLELDWAEKPII